MRIAVPVDQASFDVSIFDGDTGASDGTGPHWDLGSRQVVVRLYADPFLQASTAPGDLIGSWTGNAPNPTSGSLWTATSATMPDNDWWGVTVATSPAAQAPSGFYFYNLTIDLDGACNPGEQTESNLKIAASSPLTFQIPRFGLVAALRQFPNDGPIVYPGPFPPPGNDFVNAPTTYDGTFDFFFEIPPGATELRLFDGDFDHGTGGLVALPSGTVLMPCADTDDPDTLPTYADFPFSTTGASPEAAYLTGNPADDSIFDVFRRGEPGDPGRVGCVRYEVIDPNGTVYRNDNPSGSQEWEEFRIATPLAMDPADSDYIATTDFLPAGTWQVRIVGLDLSNLNFWFADTCAAVAEDGGVRPACPQSSVYLVGDTVWYDADDDGVQDAGEAGIPGVTVHLVSESGDILDTAVTGDSSSPNWPSCVANNTGLDEDGLYCFGVPLPGTYTVQVAAEGFEAGGPLEGLESTTGGESQTDGVVDDNVLTYDFGYVAPLPPCQPCDGKVTRLTLRYTGHDTELVLIKAKKGSSYEYVFYGWVSPGDELTIEGPDGGKFHGTLGTEIRIYVKKHHDWKHHTTIHTSCSEPVGPGLEAGDFEVVSGESKNGGALCPIDGGGDDEEPPPAAPGTGTIGYWKTHPEAWPVDELTLGGHTFPKSVLVDALGWPSQGNKALDLAKQLIAAKLNVAAGNESSCIAETIEHADGWLAYFGFNVPGNHWGWQYYGEELHRTLDDYNNGRLCAPHRG
jgi:hypothetical protein